jgi:nitronate monooxygenase/enoyl-[acyl-carrier protein] reductase II
VTGLHTPLCDLLGIEHPVMQGSPGPWSSPALTAAISEAGGLGSLGTALLAPEQIREQVERVRSLTQRPFAVNHTLRPLSEEAYALTLALTPAVISLALGLRPELVERAHAAGSRFVAQVHTPQQAERAAEAGADAIIAQGGEAGGFGGTISTLALVPQVVDAVAPVPVLAAGGIADGRGLAAALVLGAQGVNIGTRFMAAAEAEIPDAFKAAIVAAGSEDAVKLEFAAAVFPPRPEDGFATEPRALRTPFIDRGNADPAAVEAERDRLAGELVDSVRAGRGHELVPFAGQTAGLIASVQPAGAMVRGLGAEAEAALRRAAG